MPWHSKVRALFSFPWLFFTVWPDIGFLMVVCILSNIFTCSDCPLGLTLACFSITWASVPPPLLLNHWTVISCLQLSPAPEFPFPWTSVLTSIAFVSWSYFHNEVHVAAFLELVTCHKMFISWRSRFSYLLGIILDNIISTVLIDIDCCEVLVLHNLNHHVVQARELTLSLQDLFKKSLHKLILLIDMTETSEIHY